VASTLRFARNEGAVTLACSPSLSSQAARVADHLLYAPGETEGAMPSLTGLYALCTGIALILAKQMRCAGEAQLRDQACSERAGVIDPDSACLRMRSQVDAAQGGKRRLWLHVSVACDHSLFHYGARMYTERIKRSTPSCRRLPPSGRLPGELLS